MNKTNPKVDEYLSKADKWQAEMAALRTIALDCQLTEEFKWRQPCYTFQQSNILIISKYKACCILTFFKGVLLKDPEHILLQPGKNSQSGRLIQFTSTQEIIEMEPVIRAYIAEAIEVEKAGLKVERKETADYDMPAELQEALNEDPDFKAAYDALTPGRQRGYLIHFSAPKQSKTRTSRIEKSMGRIFDGKGIHDCVCGRSKKMPSCDGSHKYI